MERPSRDVFDELLRRARHLGRRYGVEQRTLQHHVDRFAASGMGRDGYMLGTAHATLLLLAETHADRCADPACRECVLLGEAVAQVLAAEQTYVNDQFTAIAKRTATRGPRRPWWKRGR